MAPHVIRPLRFMLPPMPRAALAAACCGSGCSSTTMLGARKLLPASRTRRSHPSCRSGSRSSGCSATASNIPTAGSTTPGWSCSTRSTPPSAAPSSARARAASRAERRDEWQLVLNDRGRREVGDRARAGQRRRPLDRRGRRHRAPRGRCRRRCGWSRAAISWCARRFEHDCGYSLQAADGRVVFALPFARGFHPDRHHRREFRRRSQFAGARSATRSSICATTVNEYFRDAGHARRTGLVVCRRARAL